MFAKILVIEMNPETQEDGSVLWCPGEISEVDPSELEDSDEIDLFEVLSEGFEEGDEFDEPVGYEAAWMPHDPTDIVEPYLEPVATEPEEIDRRWSALMNGAMLSFMVLDDPSDLVEPGAIPATELN